MGLMVSVRRRGPAMVALFAAFFVAMTATARAAEVDEAELDGSVNEVTVEQGGSSPFTISVSASGTIRCVATPSNPATAVFDTSYSIDDAGFLTAGAPSAPLPFWANGFCRVTWPGALAPQLVHSVVSAARHTPLGTYLIRLRATVTTPPGSGERLRDDANPFLRVVVVEGSDLDPPAVDCNAPAGPEGSNGWYTGDVSVHCVSSDAGSGLADPSDSEFTLTTSGEGSVTTGTRTVADTAGNSADAGPYGPFDVDLTDPTVDLSSPADGAVYTRGSPLTASYACDDAISGVASCDLAAGTAALDTDSVGWHSVTVEATDVAGRTTTVTHTYHVVYGFEWVPSRSKNGSPKAGSSIPLRWTLGGVSDLAALDSATSSPCGGGGETLVEAPGSSALRYDAATDAFHLNWKTDGSWAGTCRTLVLTFDDGSTHAVDVTFR
jgi:hypothetical protein